MKAVTYTTFLLSFLAASPVIHAKEIWVSTEGSMGGSCGTTLDTACNSIQNAITQSAPGDTIYVDEGTYIEDSARSDYTSKCTWMDDIYASICFSVSGEPDSPITLEAANGRVVIDSQGERVGLHLLSSDYITIRGLTFKNNNTIGIGSWGQVQNEVPDEDSLGKGITIEKNIIQDTYGDYGLNISGIGMWGSKDWVVRDNYISGVTSENNRDASCIQSYGVINALIEHNTMINCASGIFWKDHFIANDDRDLFFESEIRYNDIRAYKHGIQIGIRGQGSVEAGHNTIHHNVISGYSTTGIFGNMAAAHSRSGNLVIEHNILNGSGSGSAKAISVDSFESVEVFGNIFSNYSLPLEAIKYSDTNYSSLIISDYNIYLDGFSTIIDRYSDTSASYNSIEQWQSASSNGDSLLVNSPDSNSTTASESQVYSNTSPFKYSDNSIAIDFVEGNKNAGPFQDSIIAIGSSFAGPVPVNNLIKVIQ